MKKYPFSKKAVKAMLVAALALTPAASFGGVQAAAAEQSGVAAADYTTPEQVVTRIKEAYQDLDAAQVSTLNSISSKLANVGVNGWKNYVNGALLPGKTIDVQATAEFLDAFAKLALNANFDNFETQVGNFRTAQAANVDKIFGANITVDKMLAFITEFEAEFLEEFAKTDIQSTDLLALYTTFNSAMNGFSSSNSDVQEVIEAYGIFTGKFDSNKAAAQLVAILFGDSNPGSGGSTGPIVDPEPQPQPEPAEGEVALPDGATEVVTEGNTVVTQVPAAKVAEIVNQITEDKAVIALTLEAPAAGETAKAQIPADLFTQAAAKNEDAAVNVKTEEASYQLPVKEINVAELAKELGVPAGDIQITIAVNVVPQSEVKSDLENSNLSAVSDVIEFTVKAVSGDKEVSISKFSTYVKRTITGSKEFNPNRTAAVKLENGTFKAAPATFDGKEATIFKRDNSKYVIVENDKTFADVDNGANFFEESIEKLASKYIINGKTAASYAPSDAITRGEFAALISRSLGLVAADPTKSTFKDVSASQAVNKNGEINAAVEAGIIKGFPGNVFKPEQPITRAEAAIMIDRALAFTNVPASKFDTSKKVTSFKDAGSIGDSSRSSIEKAVQAGIVEGFGNGEFGAYKNTQRDQMAKVLDKLLQAANFIN